MLHSASPDAPLPPRTQVIGVDISDLDSERLSKAVHNTNFVAVMVTADQAVQEARVLEGPAVFVVDCATAEDQKAAELCAALRRECPPECCRIVALGGVNEGVSPTSVLNGFADEVIARPFDSDTLLAKVRRAIDSKQAPPDRFGLQRQASLQETIHEALANGDGGEVVVRSGTALGHIHIQRGHIVWAHLSSARATIEQVLECGGVTLDAGVAEAVREECRTSGGNFIEVLCNWGLVDEDRAKEAVRLFVTSRLKMILELPNAAALFLPKSQRHNQRLRFRVNEFPSLNASLEAAPDSSVCRDLDASGRWHPPMFPESRRGSKVGVGSELGEIADAAMRLPGALSASIVDRNTGEVLSRAGAEADPRAVTSLVSVLAQLGPEAEEANASAGARHLMARPLGASPSSILCMVFSAGDVSLGLARVLMARFASGEGAKARRH